MALPSSPAETGRANRKTVLALKSSCCVVCGKSLCLTRLIIKSCSIVQLKPIREILDDSNGFAEKANLLVEDYSSLLVRIITMTLLVN